MEKHRRWAGGRAALATVSMVAAALAVGCTPLQEDATPTKEAEPKPTSSAQVDVSVNPGTSTDDFVGAIEDVTIRECAEAEYGWAVEGIVTNSADADASYRIYVSLLGDSGETTLSLIQVDVPAMPSGDTAEWNGSFENVDGNDLTCVLRVERTDAS